jgi:hypothetical protein
MASESGAGAQIERTIVVFAAIVVSSIGMGAAFGQEPGKLTVEVGGCDALKSPAERLACYEAAVEAAKKSQARTTATVPEPAAGGAPPQTEPAARGVEQAADAPAAQSGATPQSAQSAPNTVALAGHDAAPATATERKPRRADRDPGIEISATVAALQETVPNAFLITLDNGQVWRQVRPSAYSLRSGDKVRLYSTHWGSSYRLEADRAPGFIQVERVK